MCTLNNVCVRVPVQKKNGMCNLFLLPVAFSNRTKETAATTATATTTKVTAIKSNDHNKWGEINLSLESKRVAVLLPHAVWHTHQPVVIYNRIYAWALGTFRAMRDIILNVEKRIEEEKLTWLYERNTHTHTYNDVLKNVYILRGPNTISWTSSYTQKLQNQFEKPL